jgi:hypothetical protein
MMRTGSIRATFAALTFLLPLLSCGNSSGTPTPSTAQPAAARPKPEPTGERLMQRSMDRWQKIMQDDWVAAYDFLTPEQKKGVPLAKYLGGKASHDYANPKVTEVVGIDSDGGYLRLTVLWTPQHPALAQVKLEPGQSLTQEVELIETWRWVDGDWGYVEAQRVEEFFEKKPELLKSTPPKDEARSAQAEGTQPR